MKKRLFYDKAGHGVTMLCAAFVIILTISIIYYIGSKGLSTFLVMKSACGSFYLATNGGRTGHRGKGDHRLAHWLLLLALFQ